MQEEVPCAVEGCKRDAYIRGWCNMHYQRIRKHGDPGPARPYAMLDDRGWKPGRKPKHPRAGKTDKASQPDHKPETATVRAAVLAEAAKIITKDRNSAYGEPEDNFGRIARLWAGWLQTEISTVDVAMLLLLVKIARLRATPTHMDSWTDIAGYAACGAEVASR